MIEAYARNTDPVTSKAAALTVNTNQLESLVLDYLFKHMDYGGTTEEISNALGFYRDSISPRMRPLLKKGFVFQDGTRIGSSGRAKIVWKFQPNLEIVE